ncbi:DUF6890 family protein, partial [Vibrio vulnificus]|uniref:DUF6890 family protein n=1 Tax=Vibrio vulnificus TaxID=672 RepID=UPI0010E8D1AE
DGLHRGRIVASSCTRCESNTGLINASVTQLKKNALSQALILRSHYFPHEPDSIESLAKALWLDEHKKEQLAVAVNKGYAAAYGG